MSTCRMARSDTRGSMLLQHELVGADALLGQGERRALLVEAHVVADVLAQAGVVVAAFLPVVGREVVADLAGIAPEVGADEPRAAREQLRPIALGAVDALELRGPFGADAELPDYDVHWGAPASSGGAAVSNCTLRGWASGLCLPHPCRSLRDRRPLDSRGL